MDDIILMKDVYRSYKVRKREKGIAQTIKHMILPNYETKMAVNGISFQIKEGEMVGFLGPNGSGKSTTVKMLTGILYPNEGEIKVAGYHPYRQRKQYVGNIGVVFGQKTQLAWDLPCIESFDLLRHIYKIPEKRYKKNLERYTELLEMQSFLEQPVRQLSLGQRMRADIAASLLHSPKIVFFDEPTIGVDVVGKEKIRNFLVELNKEDHITMLFTTHDMKDIEKTCNRLMIIDHGNKIYDGSLEKLRQDYGKVKMVDILLEDHCEIQEIPGVNSEYIKEGEIEKLRLSFEREKVNVNEVIKEVMKYYPIKDISVLETDIENIIREIYEKREA